MHYVLGVDIGGTFTDFSLIDESGQIALWKEASTPRDPSDAVQRGIRALAEQSGTSLNEFLDQLDLFVHGQTIATNTVIQRNGHVSQHIFGDRVGIRVREGVHGDTARNRVVRRTADNIAVGIHV